MAMTAQEISDAQAVIAAGGVFSRNGRTATKSSQLDFIVAAEAVDGNTVDVAANVAMTINSDDTRFYYKEVTVNGEVSVNGNMIVSHFIS